MAIEKRVLKTGTSWRVRWYQHDGSHRSRSFRTKREAEHFEREISTAKVQGTYVDPVRGRVTVSAVWDEYIKSRESLLKPKTLAGYRFEWRARIAPVWAGTKVESVTWEGVAKWVASLDGTVGASSIRYAHRVLTLILEHAVLTRRITQNPARAVPLPKLERKPPVFLGVQQIESLASLCAEAAPVYGDAVRLLAYLGLRSGELLELRKKDVDLARRRVSVHRNVTAVGGRYIVGTPKTKASFREIPIPDAVMPIMKRRLEFREPDDLVVSAPTNRKAIMRIENMRRDTAWKRTVGELGVPGLTVHGLRHSYASLARRSGADLRLVSKLMGHSTVGVTASVYAHIFDDELDDVANKLGDLISASVSADMSSLSPAAH